MKRVGLFGMVLLLVLPGAACWAQVATQPAVPALSEVERLKREVADLKKTVEILRTENEKLKKQWNDAVRDGTGGTATPSAAPATPATPAGAPATSPATTTSSKIEQDGPGTYRVSAGPKGRFTTTVHAKSREDAINLALKTVGKTAMAYDENADLNELKIERLGP